MKKERSTIKKKEAGKKKATLVRFLAMAPMSGKEQQQESPFDLLIESCFSGTEQEKRANIKTASKRIEATTCQNRRMSCWVMFQSVKSWILPLGAIFLKLQALEIKIQARRLF